MRTLPRLPVIAAALLLTAVAGNADQPRVALVLGGGSALGFAHVGVIQALDEAGIEADMVIGTSMGSIIGAMYACGFDATEMRTAIEAADWSALLSDARDRRALDTAERPLAGGHLLESSFSRDGISLLTGVIEGRAILQYFYRTLGEFAGVYDFDGLPVPYRAVAADLDSGERVVLSSGSLAVAMRASSAVPGVFTPIVVDGRRLVDGGVVDNLPVQVAREMGADYVIAVDVTAVGGLAEGDASRLSPIDRSIRMLIDTAARAGRPDADVTIEPDMTRFAPYEFARWAEIIEAGRQAGREALSRINLEQGVVDRFAAKNTTAESHELTSIAVSGVAETVVLPILRRAGVQIGEPAEVQMITQAVSDLYANGNVALAHYALVPSHTGVELRLSARPSDPGRLRLGVTYHERLFVDGPASVSIWGDVVLYNVTTPRSRWWTHIELIDGSSIRSTFTQPIGIPAAVEITLHVGNTHRYLTAMQPSQVYTVTRAGGRIGVAGGPPRGVRFAAGASAEWIASEPWFDDESAYQGWYAGPFASLELDTRDRSVAPDRGALLDISYRSSLTGLGAEATYHRLEGQYHQFIPMGENLTVSLRAGGLTDFDALGAGGLPRHEQCGFGGMSSFVGLPEAAILVSEYASVRAATDLRVVSFVPEVGGSLVLTGVSDLALVREQDTYRTRWGLGAGLSIVTNLVTGKLLVGYGVGPVVYVQLESSGP